MSAYEDDIEACKNGTWTGLVRSGTPQDTIHRRDTGAGPAGWGGRGVKAIVAGSVVGLLLLTSCTGSGPDYYKEFHKTLEDGRTVTCLSAGNSNGFDCDWAGAK